MMPILNYTTQISAHKTVGEIQKILAKAGAMAVSIDYGAGGSPVALTFVIRVREIPVNFRLPSRHEGVYTRLKNDPGVPPRFRNEAQARRVAWRIVKDWVEAQLAIIDAGQAELAEVFLPYAITSTGRTLFQMVEAGNFLIGPGESVQS
jgi:hypothetical protein